VKFIALVSLFAAATLSSSTALALDADAAKALAKQNNCLKCHGIDKEKEGPSLKAIAQKYKGKAGAEDKLAKHITSGEMAKFSDGHEEEHKIVKTTPANDAGQVKNLVQWILAQ